MIYILMSLVLETKVSSNSFPLSFRFKACFHGYIQCMNKCQLYHGSSNCMEIKFLVGSLEATSLTSTLVYQILHVILKSLPYSHNLLSMLLSVLGQCIADQDINF